MGRPRLLVTCSLYYLLLLLLPTATATAYCCFCQLLEYKLTCKGRPLSRSVVPTSLGLGLGLG